MQDELERAAAHQRAAFLSEQQPPHAAPRRNKCTRGGRLANKIEYEELQSWFHVPAEEAAAGLGVSLTVLKRVCRRNDIKRWPYRSYRSMYRRLQSSAPNSQPGTPQGGRNPAFMSLSDLTQPAAAGGAPEAQRSSADHRPAAAAPARSVQSVGGADSAASGGAAPAPAPPPSDGGDSAAAAGGAALEAQPSQGLLDGSITLLMLSLVAQQQAAQAAQSSAGGASIGATRSESLGGESPSPREESGSAAAEPPQPEPGFQPQQELSLQPPAGLAPAPAPDGGALATDPSIERVPTLSWGDLLSTQRAQRAAGGSLSFSFHQAEAAPAPSAPAPVAAPQPPQLWPAAAAVAMQYHGTASIQPHPSPYADVVEVRQTAPRPASRILGLAAPWAPGAKRSAADAFPGSTGLQAAGAPAPASPSESKRAKFAALVTTIHAEFASLRGQLAAQAAALAAADAELAEHRAAAAAMAAAGGATAPELAAALMLVRSLGLAAGAGPSAAAPAAHGAAQLPPGVSPPGAEPSSAEVDHLLKAQARSLGYELHGLLRPAPPSQWRQ